MFARQILIFGMVLGIATVRVSAQDAGKADVLRTADGQAIAITYYAASDKIYKEGSKEDAPVVVLLHGDDQGRIGWDKGSAMRDQPGTAFPVKLQDAGYAVITVDLRKFGESNGAGGPIKPIDYEFMATNDLIAVKQFIFDEHQKKNLNMNKLGIVAAGPTAPVALAFAANDWMLRPYDDAPVLENKTPRGQDVRAIVLLSPDTGVGRMSVNRTLTVVRRPEFNVALLVIVGAQDAQDKGQAKKVFDLAVIGEKQQNEQRMYLLEPNLKDRGVQLMAKQPDIVETGITNFLGLHLKDLNSPWRDRRNKVTGR